MCFTPPSDALPLLQTAPATVVAQPVVVSLTSLDSTTNGLAKCLVSGGCSFTYKASLTPFVSSVRGGGSSGDIVRLIGFDGTTDMTQITAPIGPHGAASMLCSVAPELQQVGYSYESAWNCSAGPSVAGRYNLTSRTDDPTYGYGEAFFTHAALRVAPDATGQVHTYVAVPHIDSLSFQSSGLLGGSSLLISGSGFDAVHPAANSVVVAGTPCTITSVALDSITCIIGANTSVISAGNGVTAGNATTALPIPGGRGLERAW